MTDRPHDSNAGEQGAARNPRGRSGELARLLENWFERSTEALDDEDAYGIAASVGFLRRTKPRLLRSDAWEALRERIESRIEQLRPDAEGELALRAQTERGCARVAAQLDEFLALARAEVRQARRQRRLEDERDEALTIAESIDRIVLVTAFLSRGRGPEARLDDDRLRTAAVDLATRAALGGEHFRTILGWFAATERSVDAAYLPTPLRWRGEGLQAIDRMLLTSGEWLQTAHARIRMYRAEEAGARLESRAARASRASLERMRTSLEEHLRLVAGSDAAPGEQWRRLGDVPATARKADGGPSMALVEYLAESLRPRLAAASAATSGRTAAILEWEDAEGWTATCLLTPGSLTTALRVEFFDREGEPLRSLDGTTVSWLGTAATIAGGRAEFAAERLRAMAGPLEVLRRSAVLFVGETPWHGSFGRESDEPSRGESSEAVDHEDASGPIRDGADSPDEGDASSPDGASR